jgi:hypothetical protein
MKITFAFDHFDKIALTLVTHYLFHPMIQIKFTRLNHCSCNDVHSTNPHIMCECIGTYQYINMKLCSPNPFLSHSFLLSFVRG